MTHLENGHRRQFSSLFLQMLAIQVIVLGEENWESLSQSAQTPEVVPILGGLTHKDYIDGPVLWSAVPDDRINLVLAVMKEGFAGGLREARHVLSNLLVSTVSLSREGAGADEIRAIRAKGQDQAAVGIFLTGNRQLESPLKGGVTTIMTDEDVLYPFIILSDQEPVFPSGASVGENLVSCFNRVIVGRRLAREFLNLLSPISRAELTEMAEEKVRKAGRQEIMAKLEVIRADGVLLTFWEVLKLNLGVINPLLNNPANLPLLIKSQQLLATDQARVGWLVQSGYFSEVELSQIMSLPFHEKIQSNE